MPSQETFLGILQGFSKAQRAKEEKTQQEWNQYRDKIAEEWKRRAEDPGRRPESKQIAWERYGQALTLPSGKKIPKELEDFASDLKVQARPQVGAPEWLGGQTTRQIPIQPSPIPSNLAGTTTSPAHLPTQVSAPVPQPPPGFTTEMSAFYSTGELARQAEEKAAALGRGQAAGKAAGAQYGLDFLDRMRQEGRSEEEIDQMAQMFGIRQAPLPKPVPPPKTTVINGKLVDTETGEVIGDYGTPDRVPKSLQDKDVEFKPGSPTAKELGPHGKVSYDPLTGGYFRRKGGELIEITDDVKAEYQEAAQRPDIGDLPSATQNNVQRLAASFDNLLPVKQYNEAALRSANVQAILAPGRPWTGPGDMAIVFEFMRALDPTSVVRESEYAEARRTGNWFYGVFAQFRGKFNPEGGFLSEQVKQDFNRVLQSKMQQATKQVRKIYTDFGRRIDQMLPGGLKGTGVDYLTDYATINSEVMGGAPGPTPPPGAGGGAAGGAPGERQVRMKDGRILIYGPDGRFLREGK